MTYILLFISVIIGYIVALYLQKKEKRGMEVFMAFSGGFLLSITVFELLPDVYSASSNNVGIYIMLGVLLQIFLEYFSKGAEHGHMHIHADRKHFPWMLFASLCVHALVEGFPISEENNLLLAIIIHKIPVAIILSFFFLGAGYNKQKTLLFLIFFALMTPVGSFVSHHYEQLAVYETQLTALVIGIFLHVSTTILFESSKNHQFDAKKAVAVIAAVVLAYFV